MADPTRDAIEQALVTLVQEQGQWIARDPVRVRTVLQHTFAGSPIAASRELEVAIAAAEHGVVDVLSTAADQAPIDGLVGQLERDRGFTADEARWAVAGWSRASGRPLPGAASTASGTTAIGPPGAPGAAAAGAVGAAAAAGYQPEPTVPQPAYQPPPESQPAYQPPPVPAATEPQPAQPGYQPPPQPGYPPPQTPPSQPGYPPPAAPPPGYQPPPAAPPPGAYPPPTVAPVPYPGYGQAGPPGTPGPGGGGYGAPPPGGPPPAAGGSGSGSGSKVALIVGLAVLAVIVLGGGIAFIATRGGGEVASPPATTSAPATTTKKSTTTTEDEETTTTRRSSTTRRSTTTTEADEPTTTAEVPLAWTTFNDPAGRFNIDFAGPYRLEQQNTNVQWQNVGIYQYTSVAKGVTYRLTVAEAPPGFYFPNPQSTIDGAVKGLAEDSGGAVVSADSNAYAGNPASHIHVKDASGEGEVLGTIAGNRYYILSALGTPDLAKGDFPRFLQGFHLT